MRTWGIARARMHSRSSDLESKLQNFMVALVQGNVIESKGIFTGPGVAALLMIVAARIMMEEITTE